MAERAVADFADLRDGGMKPVEIDGTKIVLVRLGETIHALAGECPHQGGPLHEGAVCNGRLVCPWHSGTFEIQSGALVEPPPMQGLARYKARVENGTVMVDPEPLPQAKPARRKSADKREFVLVGSGAGAAMAATSLREFGFTGRIIMIGPDPSEPIDRTLLSKQALSGEMGLDDAALWGGEQARQLDVEREMQEATALDAQAKQVTLRGGRSLRYDCALMATGGQPRTLTVPGNDLANVWTLRHRSDAERLIAAGRKGARAVVVGTSFIGMEAAAALTQRGVSVTAVGPETLPFAEQFGPEVANALKELHERKGVTFHLGKEVARFEGDGAVKTVVLKSGEQLAADFVLVGIGVRPATDVVRGLERRADGGIIVDRTMRAADGLYATGDIAVFPDQRSGAMLRIEHWRVAEQQARVAAHNMAGAREEWARVPFFWTQHYETILNYVGHADKWDRIVVDGEVSGFDFLAFYVTGGTVGAVLTAGRDRQTAMLSELMREPASLETLRARLGAD